MVTLEELVPADHLLRLIDRHIPFDFSREAPHIRTVPTMAVVGWAMHESMTLWCAADA